MFFVPDAKLAELVESLAKAGTVSPSCQAYYTMGSPTAAVCIETEHYEAITGPVLARHGTDGVKRLAWAAD